MNVEHGNANGEAADDGFGGVAWFAIHQADVGGSAAHVESEQAPEATGARAGKRTDDSAGGAGEDRANRMTGGVAGREESAVRLHDGDAETLGLSELAQVRFHERANVGVDGGCRRALIFTEFRADVVRSTKINTVARQGFRGQPLMRGVLIGVQKADGDRTDACPNQRRGQALQGRGGRRAEHGTVKENAFIKAEAQRAIDQKRARRGGEIVQLGTILAADFEKILEAGGGDEGGAGRPCASSRALVADSGAVNHFDTLFCPRRRAF